MRQFAIAVFLASTLSLALAQGGTLADVKTGATLAELKAIFPNAHCEARDRSLTCKDVVPAYVVGAMPAYVLMEFDPRHQRATTITVRFHRRWSTHFLEKGTERYGAIQSVLPPARQRILDTWWPAQSDEERVERKSCPTTYQDTKYVHGKWKRPGEAIEFWSFVGRTCSARVIYKAM